MKRKRLLGLDRNIKIGIVAGLAVVIVGGSFSLTSGLLVENPITSVAAAIAALTGRPYVTLTRSYSSPTSFVVPAHNVPLAVFDLRHTGIQNNSQMQNISIRVENSNPKAIALRPLNLQYSYCSTVRWGYGYSNAYSRDKFPYGYVRNQCSSITLNPTGVSGDSNSGSYRILFAGTLPVVPGQTSGVITIIGGTYFKAAPLTQSGANIRISMSSMTGKTTRCENYGYPAKGTASKNLFCNSNASVGVSLLSARGNWLAIARNYGYGYGYTDRGVRTY